METKIEITFKDGSVINLTESQYKEIKSKSIPSAFKSKYCLDYFRLDIPKRVLRNGSITESRLFNLYRNCDRIELNEAIKSLVVDGVIKITESTNLYNKSVGKFITLI